MEKITKKKFIELLVGHESKLVSCGYMDYKPTEEILEELSKGVIYSSNHKGDKWRRVIKVQTNSLCFGQSGDNIYRDGSWLYFDEKNMTREYYRISEDTIVFVSQITETDTWDENKKTRRSSALVYKLKID